MEHICWKGTVKKMSICIRLCLCFYLITTVETLENLALGKQAQMSSQRSIAGADAAVDGNTAQTESSGTCALTDLRGHEAWWRVDMNETYATTKLTVYLLNTNIFRFRYYSVHVTDDLDNLKSSVPCAKNDIAGGAQTSVVDVNCDAKGRYVTIWLKRPIVCGSQENDNFCDILQLCEVQVLGCQPGNYSQNCNKTCPVNCRDDVCAIDNGKCYSCKDGFLGDNCDQACEAGKFGRDCKSTCNGFCRNGETCSNVNGYCPDGCMDGYEGNYCNQPCSNRTFGFDCREDCGFCVNNELCHHTTGVCGNGCDNGWKGTHCNISCDPGEYGPDCQQNCSENCSNKIRCDRFTGFCENGCKPGWIGNKCNNECVPFSYGQNCTEECGNCINNAPCHHVDGVCPAGCNEGWKGELCKTECDNYTFGYNCSQNCSRNCRHNDACNRTTGFCDMGCKKGWTGMYCNETCTYGTYGYDCSMACSGNCKNNNTCDSVSGICSEGCRAGYKGDNCNITCEDGEYGENCLNKCGNCYNSTACNKVNGECEQGCAAGYKDSICNTSCKPGEYGRNCQYNCSGNCVNNEICDGKTGGCPNGCTRGWQGSICNTSCTLGTFGFGCNETCGNCLNNETCYVSNGTCPSGCASGWLGETCKTECPNGRYGLQCKGICSDNCQLPCNKVTGHCDTGCTGGWEGIFCNQSCELGTYGPTCAYNCSGNCRGNDTCSIYNGACPHGCDNGWMDPLCSTVCQSGMYGADCVYTCGGCVNGTACDIITGGCKGGCMDGYFGQFCKKNGSKEDAQIMDEPKTSAAGIAAGVSVSILIFVAVIVILFLIRRRRMKGSESTQNLNQPLAIMKTVYENVSFRHKSDGNRKSTVTYDKDEEDVVDTEDEESRDAEEDHPERGSVYYNISKFVDDIPLTDLKENILKKSEEENKKFKEEYCVLPKGLIDKCDAAKLPGNVTKNRYKTTLAYDHSRIVLQSKSPDGNDYINANYIDGVLSKKKYIASQGPRVSTFRDHWCMIWQEHVEKIVMLTNLEEKGKKKCDQYWPDIESTLTAGEFSVSLLAHQTYASYTIRKLKVTQSETNESRKVTHFHFTSWPDHGVPDSLELVLFHKRVNSLRTKGPILVHCSAGIGRTGTYIALDALTESGTEAGKINVFEYVRVMRRNRVGMIQTVNQYIAVHWCVFEHLRTVAYNIPKDTFADDVKVKEESQNHQRYQEEFQIIEAMKPGYDKSVYTVGMLDKNKNKNVTEDILPVERYSAFIPSNAKDQKGYINAVYVSSYTDPHGFIVTQIPTRDTEADFINLLIDHYITTVVVLLTDGEDIENWSWLSEVKLNSPRGQIKVNLNFKATRVSDIEERRIKLKRKSLEKSIQMFSTQCLDRNDISKTDLSRLVKLASMIKSNTDNAGQRIALLSRDGAAGCALLLTLYNAIEQMQMDGEVDIFTIMRRLKVRRPQLCSSLAEYTMCYQIVADYIIETSVYANS